jgi:peptide chain release factor subunit 1
MKPERFRSLAKADGPFASVYFDDSHDTENAVTRLEVQWKDIEERLKGQGADTTLMQRVRRAYVDTPPAVGRRGRAIIAGRDVLLTEALDRVPDQLVVRVSDRPLVVPLVEHGPEPTACLVAVVDHVGADLTVHRDGKTITETVEAGARPVHKASGPEHPGYGDPQRAAEGAAATNVRAAAERVTALTDEHNPEAVFVVGEVRSRKDFIADLPKRVGERTVELELGARHSVDEQALKRELAATFELRHADVIDHVVQRFQAELSRQSGLSTEGLLGVCGALRDGAVETLLIGDLGDATVLEGDPHQVLAPNADVLSEMGSAPGATLRADEALPLAAVAIDADLIVVGDRATLRDGVGAILRYAPRTSASP